MQIKSAEFVISSPGIQKCPDADRPEYAFIGRSNVGKSSLINKLANKKNLAKTSSTPGKTVLINHFAINGGKMFWADLPGFGYARRSKKMIKQLQTMIYGYLKHRSNLLTTFVLIDSRHEPQPIDLKFLNWCGANQTPIAIIFTKTDKLKPGIIDKNVSSFQDAMLEDWQELPPMFITSAITGDGLEEILKFMDYTNKFYQPRAF
ncbi:MAG: ribosome biogenesis GTP-binding protein YihA/YsxC [Bacteroidales bacterium]